MRKISIVLCVILLLTVFISWTKFLWAKSVVDDVVEAMTYSVEIGFGPIGDCDVLGRKIRNIFDYQDYCHRATFDLAFRDCREFECYYPTKVDFESLGRALSRVKTLEVIRIDAPDAGLTPENWDLFLSGIGHLPNLREICLSLQTTDPNKEVELRNRLGASSVKLRLEDF